MTMRRFGHSEAAANEVSVALTLLSKYGVTISVAHSNGSLSSSSLNFMGLSGVDQSTAAAVAANTAANNSIFGAIGQGNWESVNGASSPSLHPIDRYVEWAI